MQEVNVFGTKKYELIGEEMIERTQYVKIYSEKQKQWNTEKVTVMISQCPVCKKPLKVRFIPMTWSLWCCSDECYKEYDLAKKQNRVHKL